MVDNFDNPAFSVTKVDFKMEHDVKKLCNSSSNTSARTCISDEFLNSQASFPVDNIIAITAYVILIVLGTIGNSFVVKWFLAKRKMTGSKFVIMLALTDLLNSIVSPLDTIHVSVSRGLHPMPFRSRWYLGEFMCSLMSGLPRTLLCASPWLLVAISVERYR